MKFRAHGGWASATLRNAIVACALPAAAWAQNAPQPGATTAPSAATGGQQEQIQEVIVTATRQGATSLERTPLAVSVLSGNAIEQSITTSVMDLTELAPNINVTQNTASAEIYIRGIGTNNVLNGSDPDVTVQADGVYLARAFETFSDFFDVDRIEILRGPQGTLYGRNAVGGVINIISRAPTDTLTAKEQVTVGTYGTFQDQGYISGPIVKGVLDGSVAIDYIRHDGYIKNLVPGGGDDNSANHGGVRTQLRWLPNDWLDATTRLDYSQASENTQGTDHLRVPAQLPYDATSIPLPAAFSSPLANSLVGQYFETAHNQPDTLREINKGVAEDINIEINNDLKLKSLTAYRHGAYTIVSDTDATEVNEVNVTLEDNSDQISQELDLNGHYGPFDFVSGLYFFQEREHSYVISASPPSSARLPASSVYVLYQPYTKATSKAAFAQGTYKITPDVTLTVGGRYTSDFKDFYANSQRFAYATAPIIGAEAAGLPFLYHTDPHFSDFTPKAGIDWQATKDALLYFSFTQGFKSGGNNYGAACTSTSTATVYANCLASITYLPEKVTSYEAGLKSVWLDDRLIVNLTGFYYDYTNLQVLALLGTGVSTIGNAASATGKGLELETQAKVTDKLTLTADGSFLDAQYNKYPASSVPAALVPFVNTSPNFTAGPNTYNATGNYLNNAPKYSFTLAAQYTQPLSSGSAYGRTEFYYQTRMYFDPSNALVMSQGAYGLWNLAVGYTSPGNVWTASLVAKNVLNRGYYISTSASAIVPVGLSGTPRTVLFRIARSFE